MSTIVRLQFSSGRGPAECRMAVAGIVKRFIGEAEAASLRVIVESENKADHRPLSMSLSLTGNDAETFIESWIGPLLWVCPSPLRGKDSRKRWFIHCTKLLDIADVSQTIRPEDCKWSTMRSSGAGGQHVNKTESAVRLQHVPTGIVVESEDQRSQHQNKSIALEKLARTLAMRQQEKDARGRERAWTEHDKLERGKAVRTFKGPDFV